jgi:hypothetical protein
MDSFTFISGIFILQRFNWKRTVKSGTHYYR